MGMKAIKQATTGFINGVLGLPLNIIFRSDKVRVVVHMLRHINDQEFLRKYTENCRGWGNPWELKIGSDTLKENHVRVERGGDTYILLDVSDKVGHRPCGYGAFLRLILNGCYICERLGFIPYIAINRSIYNIPGGMDGHENAFEYFYYQYCDVSCDKIKEKYVYFEYEKERGNALVNDIFIADQDRSEVGENYIAANNEVYLQTMGEVMRKYFRPREDIFATFREEMKSIGIVDGNRTLGIHIRGGSFKSLKPGGHPIPVTVEDFFPFIEEAISAGFEKIFLATDDESYLKCLLDRYGDRIAYYQNTFRTDSELDLMDKRGEREQHGYLLAREVMRDMYTLSCCGGLLAGVSNVPIFARIQKYAAGEEYKFLHIIDKGINLGGGREFLEGRKRFRQYKKIMDKEV